MKTISTEKIKEAVYKLCFEANTCLDDSVYSKILALYNSTNDKVLKAILQNAKIAYEKKLPLCQDTGQVLVFVEIGQNVKIEGEFIEEAINSAVEKCYIENFFRKSVVKNAVFNRDNTQTNTPAIIYTKVVKGDEINIKVLIKGAGSENKSKLEMMLPTSSQDEIIEKCVELILCAGKNACPPMIVGIGIGGTADKASILSKEVLVSDNFSQEELELAEEIKNRVNKNENLVLDVKLKSIATHIACMPVSITINCHSDRFSSCSIKGDEINYYHKTPNFVSIEEIENSKEVYTNDIEAIKSLKVDEEVLLTGEIYVARDMAHKRMLEEKELPIDIKDKIIFYAGPCPNSPDRVIGSIGPTTAGRMDKFAVELYDKGLLATIGKGDRNIQVQEAIKRNNGKYFTVIGGIAALLADKVKKKEIIAYEDLGAEALYLLEVEKLPVKVELS